MQAYEAYLLSNGLDDALRQAKINELKACRSGVGDPGSVLKATADAIWGEAQVNSQNTLGGISSAIAAVAKMPGQRMVLLTSAGFLSGGLEQSLQDVITMAEHSGVVINAMDLRGVYTVVPGGAASEEATRVRGRDRAQEMATSLRIQGPMEGAKADGMGVLAAGTGGRFVQNNNDLAAGFRLLAALPEVLYVLGFDSSDVAHDGKYHPLKVRLVGGPHGSLQARMGYNAPPKEPPADLTRLQDRDRILMSSEEPSEVAVRIK